MTTRMLDTRSWQWARSAGSGRRSTRWRSVSSTRGAETLCLYPTSSPEPAALTARPAGLTTTVPDPLGTCRSSGVWEREPRRARPRAHTLLAADGRSEMRHPDGRANLARARRRPSDDLSSATQPTPVVKGETQHCRVSGSAMRMPEGSRGSGFAAGVLEMSSPVSPLYTECSIDCSTNSERSPPVKSADANPVRTKHAATSAYSSAFSGLPDPPESAVHAASEQQVAPTTSSLTKEGPIRTTDLPLRRGGYLRSYPRPA